MKIFLDMDGVMVDFNTEVAKLWGVTLEEITPHWAPGRWDILEALSLYLDTTVTLGDFWRRVDAAGADFWERIPEYPWCDDLIAWASSYTREWYILSAPSYCPNSYLGKTRWLKRKFGREFTRFIPTIHKELFAEIPGSILIDDREENVVKFNRHGGRGILFPSHGNSEHPHKENPLYRIRQIF